MEMKTEKEIGKKGIKKVVPFREPFLFIDGVLVCDTDTEEIIALKAVTISDCAGHFGVYPGHLLLESLAQTASFLVLSKTPLEKGWNLALIKSEGRFYHYVFPGDFLFLHAKQEKRKEDIFFLKGRAIREGNVVATWKGVATAVANKDR